MAFINSTCNLINKRYQVISCHSILYTSILTEGMPSLSSGFSFPLQRGQGPSFSSGEWTPRRHKWPNAMSCNHCIGWQWRAASSQDSAGAAGPARSPGALPEHGSAQGCGRTRSCMGAGAGSAAPAHSATWLHHPLLLVSYSTYQPTSFTLMPP